MFRRFMHDTAGVTATEYCLILSLSGGTAFLFLNRYADALANVFSTFIRAIGL